MHTNSSVPHWPQYDAEQRAVMSFNTASVVVHDPAMKRREWWYSKVYKPALE
jgi:carboxylesterase type B